MSNPPPPVEPSVVTSTLAPEDYQALVQGDVDHGISVLDAEGRVLSWNAGARQIYGYAPDEIVGAHWGQLFVREDVAAGRPAASLRTARGSSRLEEDGWRLRKDGTRFWANVVVTPRRGTTGELLGFGVFTRDFSERRASEETARRAEQQRAVEERLRQSEDRFRLLVESVSDYAIYMLSPSGEVETWNIGAQRMKGFTASEIIGQHFSVFFPAEERAGDKPRLELATASAEGRFEDEGYRVRKDGTRFWANVVVTAIRGGQGELIGFAKVTRDLTARRDAEETARELAQAHAARTLAEAVARKADEANRVKDEFLAMVSHELRTPLNAIVGWSSILRQKELEPALARAMEVIERNALSQVKIIEDILDISRIITGKLRIDPKPADWVAIVNQALDVVRHSAAAKHIRLEFPAAASRCPIVGDAERLQQVVWNLVSNAVKFTGAGGVVRVQVELRPGLVTLHVTDSGIGIDAELLPALFERFKQGDSSSTRRFGGLGLGLALVRHIAELHGGSVAASSPGPGRGSTFSVSLPRDADAETRVIAAAEASASGGAPAAALAGLRVLLVEDDLDSRELVGAILTDAGARVQAVGGAAQALAALSAFRPHVLVSDIAMPDEDGYVLIRRVRALDAAHGGAVPSLALTAYTRPEDRQRAIAAGFTAHVPKPVNPPELIAVIANLGALARG